VREPLETRRIGVTERVKQSLYIPPAVGTQYALKVERLDLTNALISFASLQSKAASGNRFDPHFILERHTLAVTGDERSYKLPKLSHFRLIEFVQPNQRTGRQIFELHFSLGYYIPVRTLRVK
jgi:hypothetical protein